MGETFVRMRRTKKPYEPITDNHRFSLRCCEGIILRFISMTGWLRWIECKHSCQARPNIKFVAIIDEITNLAFSIHECNVFTCVSRAFLLLMLLSVVITKIKFVFPLSLPIFCVKFLQNKQVINTEQQNKCNIKCFLRPQKTELLWTLDTRLKFWQFIATHNDCYLFNILTLVTMSPTDYYFSKAALVSLPPQKFVQPQLNHN